MALRFGLKEQQKSGWRTAIGILGAVVCLLVADLPLGAINNVSNSPIAAIRLFSTYVFGLLATASILWAFLHIPTRFLHARWIYLGKISYGLYVFHGVFLLLGETVFGQRIHSGVWLPFAAAAILGAAVLSYEYFEKPFLRLKYRFEMIHSRGMDNEALAFPTLVTPVRASLNRILVASSAVRHKTRLDASELPIVSQPSVPSDVKTSLQAKK